MTALLIKLGTYLLSTKLLKAIVVSLCEVLVERTDNTVDDEILKKVKEYMK